MSKLSELLVFLNNSSGLEDNLMTYCIEYVLYHKDMCQETAGQSTDTTINR